eukprot:3430300-Rhodomonas_salina.2
MASSLLAPLPHQMSWSDLNTIVHNCFTVSRCLPHPQAALRCLKPCRTLSQSHPRYRASAWPSLHSLRVSGCLGSLIMMDSPVNQRIEDSELGRRVQVGEVSREPGKRLKRGAEGGRGERREQESLLGDSDGSDPGPVRPSQGPRLWQVTAIPLFSSLRAGYTRWRHWQPPERLGLSRLGGQAREVTVAAARTQPEFADSEFGSDAQACLLYTSDAADDM